MKKLKPLLLLPVLFLMLALNPDCFSSPEPKTISSQVPNHQQWDKLLKEHVRTNGLVDYKGFIQDSVKLNQYLDGLLQNEPAEIWSDDEKLAYWINAYNAFTIQLVIRHYPVESIKDIGPMLQIPFVNTPWDIKFIKYPERSLDLNNIEHGIIREEFDEPRIHFAVNCASISCAQLRREAYTGDQLDKQLDEQTREFLKNPHKNEITKDYIKISKLFRWYGSDFKTDDQSIIDFINQYSETEIQEDAKVDYKDYNWELNDVQD